jgi:hypothetical protein
MVQEAVSDSFEELCALGFAKSLHSKAVKRLLVDLIDLFVPVGLHFSKVV